jgi:glycosidase
MLVFNGQIFGKQHAYKKQMEETLPAPRVTDANSTERETGKRLFGLRKEYPQLVGGDYKFLENGEQDVICLARYDESNIVIGVINADSDAKEVLFSLSDIIGVRLNPLDIELAYYTQDALLLKNSAEGWISETRFNMPAEQLLREGLHVGIGPRSCQVIRLCLNM